MREITIFDEGFFMRRAVLLNLDPEPIDLAEKTRTCPTSHLFDGAFPAFCGVV
jgi:hypothetical protein